MANKPLLTIYVNKAHYVRELGEKYTNNKKVVAIGNNKMLIKINGTYYGGRRKVGMRKFPTTHALVKVLEQTKRLNDTVFVVEVLKRKIGSRPQTIKAMKAECEKK